MQGLGEQGMLDIVPGVVFAVFVLVITWIRYWRTRHTGGFARQIWLRYLLAGELYACFGILLGLSLALPSMWIAGLSLLLAAAAFFVAPVIYVNALRFEARYRESS